MAAQLRPRSQLQSANLSNNARKIVARFINFMGQSLRSTIKSLSANGGGRLHNWLRAQDETPPPCALSRLIIPALGVMSFLMRGSIKYFSERRALIENLTGFVQIDQERGTNFEASGEWELILLSDCASHSLQLLTLNMQRACNDRSYATCTTLVLRVVA